MARTIAGTGGGDVVPRALIAHSGAKATTAASTTAASSTSQMIGVVPRARKALAPRSVRKHRGALI